MNNRNILLFGSSIINRWNNLKINNYNIINKGIIRLKTFDLLNHSNNYLNYIQLYNPIYIIIYIGGNDIRHDINNEIIYNNIIKFIKNINNKIKIILISILKFRSLKKNDIQYVNNKLKLYLLKNNNVFINVNRQLNNIKYFEYDNIHLNNLGYVKLNNIISKIIKDF